MSPTARRAAAGARPFRSLAAGALLLFTATAGPAEAEVDLPPWTHWKAGELVQQGHRAHAAGQASEARRLAVEAARLVPEAPAPQRLLCWIDAGAAAWEAAAVPCSRWELRSAEPGPAALALARVHLERGARAEALAACDRADEAMPSDPAPPIARALVLARIDRDWPRVATLLREATRRDPTVDLAQMPLLPGWSILREDDEFLNALAALLRP